MSEKISISVIIPAFNAASTIKRAVESILMQTNQEYIKEIIIINDGSTDSTTEIVNEIIDKTNFKITLIEQSNKGVSEARNAGIKIAKGNWIGLLDADDSWAKNKIEQQVEAILKHKEIKAIGSNRDTLIRKRGRKISKNLYQLNIVDELWSYWPSTPTLLFKKDVLDKIGGYDNTRSYAEDGDLLLKITSKYGIYYMQESLVTTANKPAYGYSGLSANNRAMHIGSILNVKNAHKRKDINLWQSLFFCFWEDIKYLRRIIITLMQKRNKI